MKQLFTLIIALVGVLPAFADGVTPNLTVYKQFKPATIQLVDGRTLQQPLANIFLKNSNLLYVSGSLTKEARLANILSVDFEDRHYVKIDTLLAYQVDTVANNALFCATLIDLVAYNTLLKNNKMITNLDLSANSSLMQTATIDLEDVGDIHFPVINVFYYRLNGEYVRVHERHLQRVLNKEQRRMLRTYVNERSFSWNDPDSLMKLLKSITEFEEK
jgi:hypothetical protein